MTFLCKKGFILLLALVVICLFILFRPNTPPALLIQSPPLEQHIYVWQRNWTAHVYEAVASGARHFEGMSVLAGELAWNQGYPELEFVLNIQNSEELKKHPITLAIRIPAYSGPFHRHDRVLQSLIAHIEQVRESMTKQGLDSSGIQIDFDCASANLMGYRLWLQGFKSAFPDLQLSITALPAWLKAVGCRGLFTETDYVVLQVHSLQKPLSINDPVTLCDPEKARAAALEISRMGVPFLIALPTYSYRLAYHSSGDFVGLSAEDIHAIHPDASQFRLLESDPDELAELVADWKESRPENMIGLIWFRLPVTTDRLNWHWTTLESVMQGVPPRSLPEIRVQSADRLLFDLSAINHGNKTIDSLVFTVTVEGSVIESMDAFNGFKTSLLAPEKALFESVDRSLFLEPKAEIPLGWIRLISDGNIKINLAHEESD